MGTPAFQALAFQLHAFQIGQLATSTSVLDLPVDYFMEGLPQYRRIGSTFEPSKGKASEIVIVERGKGGRLTKTVPSFTSKTGSRGYD